MKTTFLSVLLILSITGYGVMAQDESAMTEQRMSPACALAVAAAMEDLRAWYSERYTGEPARFEAYLEKQYEVVVCSKIDGHRISVALGQSSPRGGGVWYAINADTFEIVERVFGR
jgi:hypothetical protein